MKSVISALLVIGMASACSKPSEAVNVQELNQQFIGAWNNKDADKINALLADDVHFLQGNAHYKGKSEVADKWVKSTLSSLSDLKTNVVSSAADSQTAYEAGTFSVDVAPAAANEPRGFGEGNFILLWKKGADMTWKLSYAQLEDLPVQVKN